MEKPQEGNAAAQKTATIERTVGNGVTGYAVPGLCAVFEAGDQRTILWSRKEGA